MIRTISDLLRHYGDRTVLTLKGDGRGNRTVITFEIDHPAECLRCGGSGYVLQRQRPLKDRRTSRVVCPVCHGSGLAVEIGGEG